MMKIVPITATGSRKKSRPVLLRSWRLAAVTMHRPLRAAALSRRKFAIRAFDLARRQAMTTYNAPTPTTDSDYVTWREEPIFDKPKERQQLAVRRISSAAMWKFTSCKNGKTAACL